MLSDNHDSWKWCSIYGRTASDVTFSHYFYIWVYGQICLRYIFNFVQFKKKKKLFLICYVRVASSCISIKVFHTTATRGPFAFICQMTSCGILKCGLEIFLPSKSTAVRLFYQYKIKLMIWSARKQYILGLWAFSQLKLVYI